MKAASEGHESVVTALVAAKAGVDMQDKVSAGRIGAVGRGMVGECRWRCRGPGWWGRAEDWLRCG